MCKLFKAKICFHTNLIQGLIYLNWGNKKWVRDLVYNISSCATFLRLLYIKKSLLFQKGLQVCYQLYTLIDPFNHQWSVTISGVEHSSSSSTQNEKHFFGRWKQKISASTAVPREIVLSEYNYCCWKFPKTLEVASSTAGKGPSGSSEIKGAQGLRFTLSSEGIGWYTWKIISSLLCGMSGISTVSNRTCSSLFPTSQHVLHILQCQLTQSTWSTLNIFILSVDLAPF